MILALAWPRNNKNIYKKKNSCKDFRSVQIRGMSDITVNKAA
jgi:hypothetical protein